MWMAGGGVKGGQTIGSTDDLGLRGRGKIPIMCGIFTLLF